LLPKKREEGKRLLSVRGGERGEAISSKGEEEKGKINNKQEKWIPLARKG